MAKWLTPAAVGALVALALTGCGGSDSSTSSTSAAPPPAPASSPAASASPSASSDQLALNLSGGLSGTLDAVTGTPDCVADYRPDEKIYHVQFDTTRDSLQFEVLINDITGPGTFQVSDQNVSVDGADDAKQHWSSLGEGVMGTVTVAPDNSGTIDATIPSRDPNGGLPGDGSTLTIKGTWSCKTYRQSAA